MYSVLSLKIKDGSYSTWCLKFLVFGVSRYESQIQIKFLCKWGKCSGSLVGSDRHSLHWDFFGDKNKYLMAEAISCLPFICNSQVKRDVIGKGQILRQQEKNSKFNLRSLCLKLLCFHPWKVWCVFLTIHAFESYDGQKSSYHSQKVFYLLFLTQSGRRRKIICQLA